VKIKNLVVGPIETNCYIFFEEVSRKAVVIDPGGDIDKILGYITETGLDVEWILLTHGHFDHTFYAGDLALRLNAKIGMHEEDISMLSTSLDVAEIYYEVDSYMPFQPTDLLNDGDVINLGNSKIEVIHTPGHSKGGLCFVTEIGIFCGDTIFNGSIGRTDFSGGSYDQLIHSIREKILKMDDKIELYCGHGAQTTIGTERRSNPFLSGL
jgi:hydroxyacylglutathione hydrolase